MTLARPRERAPRARQAGFAGARGLRHLRTARERRFRGREVRLERLGRPLGGLQPLGAWLAEDLAGTGGAWGQRGAFEQGGLAVGVGIAEDSRSDSGERAGTAADGAQ